MATANNDGFLTYGKFEKLAFEAQFSVGILGNTQTSYFEFVDTCAKPLSEDAQRNLHQRGMGFLGVIGLVRGTPRVAFEEPLDSVTVSVLTQAFMQWVYAIDKCVN